MSRQGTETSYREMGRKDLVVYVRLHISSAARCVGVLAASGGEMLKVVRQGLRIKSPVENPHSHTCTMLQSYE